MQFIGSSVFTAPMATLPPLRSTGPGSETLSAFLSEPWLPTRIFPLMFRCVSVYRKLDAYWKDNAKRYLWHPPQKPTSPSPPFLLPITCRNLVLVIFTPKNFPSLPSTCQTTTREKPITGVAHATTRERGGWSGKDKLNFMRFLILEALAFRSATEFGPFEGVDFPALTQFNGFLSPHTQSFYEKKEDLEFFFKGWELFYNSET